MAEKKRRTIYRSEIVWYSILGGLWLFGLILAILGVCAYNVGKISLNPLYGAERAWAAFFGMPEGSVLDFRIVGSIVMVVSMLCFFIAIYAYSSKVSEEKDHDRRLQPACLRPGESRRKEIRRTKTKEKGSLGSPFFEWNGLFGLGFQRLLAGLVLGLGLHFLGKPLLSSFLPLLSAIAALESFLSHILDLSTCCRN